MIDVKYLERIRGNSYNFISFRSMNELKVGEKICPSYLIGCEVAGYFCYFLWRSASAILLIEERYAIQKN